METKSIIQLSLILLLSIKLCGQTDNSNKVKKFFLAPSIGYMWQGTNNLDFGIQPMMLLDAKRNHSNVGLLISGNILYYDNSTYVTPMAKLKIMKHDRKRFLFLGWLASLGYSYTNIQKKYDHRLTPEIGIKLWGFDLSIGYNIPLVSFRDNFTNGVRLAIRFNSH